MHRKQPLTGDQARESIRRQGITITEWSRQRGWPREDVYDVLRGVLKGNFGRAHDIAVALGMKLPDAQPSSPSAGGNTHLDAAA